MGVALTRLGPIYIGKVFTESVTDVHRSMIVLPLDLNDGGLRLFITSFSNFHVVLRSFLASSSLSRNMCA